LNRRSSSSRLTDAFVHEADEQRRRLARLIHDGPAQLVAAAAMNLELVEREAARLGTTAREALTSARQQLHESAADLSRLSHEQEPPFLGEGGLLNAALTLARRSGQRLDLQLDTSAPFPRLGRPVELGAYRLLEFGLGDLFAPGKPVTARLALARNHLAVTLSGVAGVGSGAATQLLALRYRVQMAGGQVIVARLTGRKTGRRLQLAARLPVTRPTRKSGASGTAVRRSRAVEKKSGGP
jgi:two-component system sensor histidine kinase DegS